MLLIDAHEDLAYNVLNFGRDYLHSAAETRRIEAETGSAAPQHNGQSMLGWQDYQEGGVGLVFATLFAAPERKKLGDWDRLTYRTADEAHRLYSAQLDVTIAGPTTRRIISGRCAAARSKRCSTPGCPGAPPDTHDPGRPAPPRASVDDPGTGRRRPGHPVGLGGLNGRRRGACAAVERIEMWWARRSHHRPGLDRHPLLRRHREPGRSAKKAKACWTPWSFGFSLISATWTSRLPAGLDRPAPSSPATPTPCARSRAAIQPPPHRPGHPGRPERTAIGVVPFNRFLKAGWARGDNRTEVTLDELVAHIDYICQLAGDARHVGIGSDFDGGFGVDSTPLGLETIADLQKIVPLLQEGGYSEVDIQAIFGGNWPACWPALPD
jgi:membrane dipeptidase